jgi:hypothetical protein
MTARHPARLRDAASQIADVRHRLVLVLLLRVGYAHQPVRRARKQIARPFRGPGKVHGGDVIRVRGRVPSQWRGGMPWVPVNRLSVWMARFYRVYKRKALTHQYRISASSCLSSVPAATVRPSEDRSQERRALKSPSNDTAIRERTLLSGQNALVFPHVLLIDVAPVRSSHTRTMPSFPEEIIVLMFVPATESTARKDVVPP